MKRAERNSPTPAADPLDLIAANLVKAQGLAAIVAPAVDVMGDTLSDRHLDAVMWTIHDLLSEAEEALEKIETKRPKREAA